MSLYKDSYTISKKQWAIIAAVAAVILFIIIKANTPHEAAPTGFVELGTTYAEAKPVILATFPGAEFKINDEMTGVSHGAIKVTVNDYEGIKGQKAEIQYIFSKSTQELDLIYFWISQPKTSYLNIFNKWKKVVNKQFSRPDVECATVSPAGGERLRAIWNRNMTEVYLDTIEFTDDHKDCDPEIFLSYTTREELKMTYEEERELIEESRKTRRWSLAHRLLPFVW